MSPKRDPRPTRATRAAIAATVAAEAAPRPARCVCRSRPQIVATFRRERLVAVEVVHWAGRDRCPMPVETIDPAEYAPLRQPTVSAAGGRV